MKQTILILLLLFSVFKHLNAQCNFIGLDSITNQEKETFKINLEKFIFQKKINGQLTVTNEILNQIKICSKDTSSNSIFDYFKSYLPEKRQVYLDSIANLKKTKISHYVLGIDFLLNEDKKTVIDMGEIFISHKQGITKARFSVFIWEGKLYLGNLMTPPN